MLKLKHLFVLLIVCCTSALAQENAPSDETIKHLIALVHVEKIIGSVLPQLDSEIDASLQKEFNGKIITREDQHTVDNLRSKLQELYRQQFSTENMMPIYVKIYRETFTQKEADDIIAFYESPSGQALLAKMPVAMKNTLAEIKVWVVPFGVKVAVMEREALAEIRSHHNNSPSPSGH